eukprot:c24488_g1_i1.p1 GENE.c24488_g1_i1~~c24488_g1_i1.p1  ORF type:complete len:360 (-),score=93.45 c24488_g1_i1:13-1092(-)
MDSSFQEGVMQVIEGAVRKKTAALDLKEKELKVREEKVDKVLKNVSTKGKVVLQVGNVQFHTTTKILLKVEDSFFHALLNPNLSEEDDESIEENQSTQKKLIEKGNESAQKKFIENDNESTQEKFIARDGNIFHYVLEYLTYDKLVTKISDENILRKLILDAEFYLLPELQQEAEEMLKTVKENGDDIRNLKRMLETAQEKMRVFDQAQEKMVVFNQAEEKLRLLSTAPEKIAKWQSTSGAGNGGYWNWNVVVVAPNSQYYELQSGNTVLVKTKGTYMVMVRVAGTMTSNSYYIELYVNGGSGGHARSMNSDSNGYYKSFHINEVFSFEANSKLQIYQSTNGSPYNTQICNQFSIIKLL